jgi:biopolymer transport protein ExbD
MHGGSRETEVNLTPLLDMVLQLIMFFMITVNFVRVEQLTEDIALPVAQTAALMEKTDDEWLFVNIDKDGKLVGTLHDLNGGRKLEEYLKNRMIELERKARILGQKGEPKVVLVLRADQNCRYKDIWDVVEIGKAAGIKRYQFRALKGHTKKA